MKTILIIIISSFSSLFQEKEIEFKFCQKINKEIDSIILKHEKIECHLTKITSYSYKLDRSFLKKGMDGEQLLEMKVKLKGTTTYILYIDRNDLLVCDDFFISINSVNKRKKVIDYDYLSCGSNRFTFQGKLNKK